MNFSFKNILATFFIFFINLSLILGQKQLIISNQNLTQGDYKARDGVQALPATLILPTASTNVNLFVDKSMIEPVEYSSTNAPITDINRPLDLSLPMGSTSSNFSVASGSSNYNIPINLPPGTMNIVPSLSVNYNSMGAQGLLGYGWNLAGLNSISRVGKTIYHNGQVDGINLNNEDVFTLDGARLISTVGQNGQNNTQYHTEEESYSRTTSNGTIGNGPAWFKVETKDGLTIELGNTADARLIPVGHNIPY